MKKSEVLVLCLIGAVVLGVVAWVGHQHGAAHGRALVSAVSQQLDGHSPQIAELLASMRGTEVYRVEDAVYEELQDVPSTSLISRSMIRVAPGADGLIECTIDTTSLGIAPRRIQASHPVTPK